MQPDTTPRPRILFLGMRCAFSAPPLQALLSAGGNLIAIVLPGLPACPPIRMRPPGQNLPIRLTAAASASIEMLADGAGIPILEVRDLKSPEVIATLRDLRPDVIAVACFPWLIPASIRSLPTLGCLNVHPSLLPRWRGPEPLFWTFKAGDTETGVTVHLMDGGFDSGPIARQERIAVADGIDGRALEQELATIGGRLLVESIAQLTAGTLAPQPQHAAHATPAPMPADEDLMVSTDQPARRVANLVRGIVPLWGPLILRVTATDTKIPVDGVLGFDSEGVVRQPLIRDGNVITVRCMPGTATLTLAGTESSSPLTLLGAV